MAAASWPARRRSARSAQIGHIPDELGVRRARRQLRQDHPAPGAGKGKSLKSSAISSARRRRRPDRDGDRCRARHAAQGQGDGAAGAAACTISVPVDRSAGTNLRRPSSSLPGAMPGFDLRLKARGDQSGRFRAASTRPPQYARQFQARLRQAGKRFRLADARLATLSGAHAAIAGAQTERLLSFICSVFWLL
jgi:hypothetical protein